MAEPSELDVCRCGDYRKDHERRGTGPCRLNGLGHGVPGYTCEEFEFSRPSEASKPVMLCRCGKVLEAPRDYAAHQQKFDMDGKALAKEIGISESTLTRIKQGRMPDASAFTKIISWLAGSE